MEPNIEPQGKGAPMPPAPEKPKKEMAEVAKTTRKSTLETLALNVTSTDLMQYNTLLKSLEGLSAEDKKEKLGANKELEDKVVSFHKYLAKLSKEELKNYVDSKIKEDPVLIRMILIDEQRRLQMAEDEIAIMREKNLGPKTEKLVEGVEPSAEGVQPLTPKEFEVEEKLELQPLEFYIKEFLAQGLSQDEARKRAAAKWTLTAKKIEQRKKELAAAAKEVPAGEVKNVDALALAMKKAFGIFGENIMPDDNTMTLLVEDLAKNKKTIIQSHTWPALSDYLNRTDAIQKEADSLKRTKLVRDLEEGTINGLAS